jgi:hypothetical protein
LESLKEIDYLGDLTVDGRIVLKWILKKEYDLSVWTGFVWLRKENQ